MEEVWKAVPDLPGCEASSLGRVRRDHRWTKKGITAGSLSGHGYLRVQVAGKEQKVHRLVALAFSLPRATGADTVNHKDGDKTNNRPENLEWCSVQDNLAHCRDAMRGNGGGRPGNAGCLTAEQVVEMRQLHDQGVPIPEIGRRFQRPYMTAYAIVKRKNWKHLP